MTKTKEAKEKKDNRNFSLQNLNALSSILDRSSWVRLCLLASMVMHFIILGDKKGHKDTVKVEIRESAC